MFNSHKRNKNDDEEQLSKTGKPSLLNVKPLQQYLIDTLDVKIDTHIH